MHHFDPRHSRQHERLDDESVDALLDREVAPEDAPDGYEGVNALLQSMVGEVDLDEATSVAFIANALTPKVNRRKKVIGRIIGAKVAAIAAGAVLSAGGVAAAATGTLPAPAQNLTANAASHVGVEIPKLKPDAKHTESAKHAESAKHSVDSLTTVPVRPSKDACEEARQVEDAHGCSAVAKAHAPGQIKKENSTTTTTVRHGAHETTTEPAESNDDVAGESHSSSQGHDNKDSSSGKSNGQSHEHSKDSR